MLGARRRLRSVPPRPLLPLTALDQNEPFALRIPRKMGIVKVPVNPLGHAKPWSNDVLDRWLMAAPDSHELRFFISPEARPSVGLPGDTRPSLALQGIFPSPPSSSMPPL